MTSTAISGTTLTVVYTGTATINVGDTWTFFGLTANPSLNGVTVTILTAGGGTFTAATGLPAYTTLAEGTGALVCNVGASGVSGGSGPAFSGIVGTGVLDGTVGWISKGASVRSMGIAAPTVAPTGGNVFTPTGTAWAASTYYWPYLVGVGAPNNSACVIVDPNNNIQFVSTPGTTNGSVPAFNTSGTTTDGTAVWTFIGPATRATNHVCGAGSWIAVTVTTSVRTIIGYQSEPPFKPIYKTIYTSNFYMFVTQKGGTSSSTATNSITWPAGLGGTVQDGTVQWTNAGYQVVRTSSATAAPSANAKGNVTNSQLVLNTSQIVDNVGGGGGTGFLQNVTTAGPSGAAHPTWATTGSPAIEKSGLVTTEASGLRWQNAGQQGAANTGTWVYTYSWGDSISRHEGPAAPLSAALTLDANSTIMVSGAGDPNFAVSFSDVINIYRSTQGATTPFRLIQIPAPLNGGAWSYADNSPDPPAANSILNPFIAADLVGANAPPPTGLTNLTYYLSRLFGSVGPVQYYSGVDGQPLGVGAESWAGSNFQTLPELISKSWPSSTGLLMFTTHGVHFSSGIDNNGNPNTPVQILEDIGLLSPNLFTVNGSIPVILTADSQMLALDPSVGLTRYSDPIADSANGIGGFSTSSSYLTWHAKGTDSAFYLADGTTGWFRLCPTAAPESGFTWSPKANITGGCGAIKSIETSPGVKQLLVAPTGTGKIYKRDLTLNSDNGTAYSAFAVLGSLVFCGPSHCAQIDSISTYCLNVGHNVAVSVVGGEIVSSPSTPFEALTNPVNEPDFLNASTSLFNTRWYMNTAGVPCWMQHMLLRFDFVAEDQPSELLSFGVYGAVHQGR